MEIMEKLDLFNVSECDKKMIFEWLEMGGVLNYDNIFKNLYICDEEEIEKAYDNRPEECEAMTRCDFEYHKCIVALEYARVSTSDIVTLMNSDITNPLKHTMFGRTYIGTSAAKKLLFVEVNGEQTQSCYINFSQNGVYKAHVVKYPDVKIGSSYKKIATYKNTLNIYDDYKLAFSITGREIIVYRNEKCGCIIQVL